MKTTEINYELKIYVCYYIINIDKFIIKFNMKDEEILKLYSFLFYLL